MLWNRRGGGPEGDDREIRRLLEAAAADPADPPEPPPADPAERREPPPFVAARVRAAAEAALRPPAHPVGAAAWQMLPALAVVAVAFSAWTGYESVRAARERQAAVSAVLRDNARLNEVVVAAMLLGTADDAGGAR
jgi:hypothetical protein